jgi:hypothetical protein
MRSFACNFCSLGRGYCLRLDGIASMCAYQIRDVSHLGVYFSAYIPIRPTIFEPRYGW